MPHNKHVEDGFNIDVGMMQPDEAKNYYLDLAGDWEDPNPPPRIVEHEGIRVVRDDDLVGSKVRGGDCLISSIKARYYCICAAKDWFGRCKYIRCSEET